jgi:hypothetical protein
MEPPSQKKRSVDSDTYTVQPGSEQSTQASLEDYELSSQGGRTRLSPKSSLKRLGESRSGNTGQLSYADIASLYETLAPLVEIARLLKERRPEHGEFKRGGSGLEPEQPSLSYSDAAVMLRAHRDESYRRIPLAADPAKNRAAEHCPFSGFNRSQIYDALKLRRGGEYVVKRRVSAKKGKSRGVTLYNVGSLLRYVESLPEELVP